MRSSIPRASILAEPPVAVVDKNVDRHKTRAAAEAFCEIPLFAPGAGDRSQELLPSAQSRDRGDNIRTSFPAIALATMDGDFGGWAKAQAVHFGDGGIFDQIYPVNNPGCTSEFPQPSELSQKSAGSGVSEEP